MYGMYLNSVSVFLLLSVYFVLFFLRISSLMFNIAEILSEISRTPDSASRDEKTRARTHNSAKR